MPERSTPVETFKESVKLIGEIAAVITAYVVVSRVLVDLTPYLAK